MMRIDGEEEIPEELNKLIRDMFEKVEEIYNQNGCNNSSISERIYVESRAMLTILNNEIAENMRSEQFQSAMIVMDRIQRSMEEIEQNNGKASEEESQEAEQRLKIHSREWFSEIGGDNSQTVASIIRAMEDVLQDIRLSQSRILYNRGVMSADRIYDIQQQVLEAIRQFENDGQEIWQMLEQKDNRLREEILEKYEEYLQSREQSREDESEGKTFRDSLNAGISLEEQSDLAKQFLEEQEKQDANDSKLLVDELPDLFL